MLSHTPGGLAVTVQRGDGKDVGVNESEAEATDEFILVTGSCRRRLMVDGDGGRRCPRPSKHIRGNALVAIVVCKGLLIAGYLFVSGCGSIFASH
jgi:hypothetical protein